MTLRDQIELAVGNLWRVKLRAFLTVSGVVIAIAAFVSLLSFGAGNQKLITERFTEFGLLTTMDVYPRDTVSNDSAPPALLDKAALEKLAAVPGVKSAFPLHSFEVTARVGDTEVTTTARVLSEGALQSKLFTRIMQGCEFSSDSAREAVITDEFAKLFKVEKPDSLVGATLIISSRAASLDSALVNIVQGDSGSFARRLRDIRFDSLFRAPYRQRVVRREMNEALRRFIEGFTTRKLVTTDTLTIKGVAYRDEGVRTAPILLPEKTARRLSSGGFGLGGSPTDLLSAMRSGRLFQDEGLEDSRSYPRVTLDLDPFTPYKQIKDSVEALGFRALSYAEEFQEIQRFFIYFNLGLGVLGLIALVTASLGIVNTMVMSIVERRREIGVVKALGADERDIRFMFLVESATIGAIGSAVGLLIGWAATRVISAVAQAIMVREGMPGFDLFALPVWLIGLALAFGIGVSMAAGLYPASRAARVDPVDALRGE